MKIKSYAKANIWLKVWKKNSFDQFHQIESLVTKVKNLYDVIYIKKITDNSDKVICKNKSLEKNNYIYDVLNILRENKIIKDYYKIYLKKNIPVGSGLGGGTSNAISVAKYFLKDENRPEIIETICKKIGFDSYYFFSNLNTAIVSGFGEVVNPFNENVKIKKQDLLFTNIYCSTKKVYENFDKYFSEEQNFLTKASISVYPELKQYKNKGIMSGSGSTFIKNSFYNKKKNKYLLITETIKNTKYEHLK
ncbi:4-diphosphocytidyl-2-C-methyl-D-erythritol kinase [Spiroplasma litorale]|uniref:4-diphosphocytidyl-2-C-methyl-D-erythritol kinase n=1 Tax=Spiroplasma litorale TaxID=216942 RepID=A0A0K1W312_9MOLU|nr:hypothetical protein [Spiroplasma litorale]AKX34709.1 4-diphosphocytidyl-2-C-methyl-D-erythritol kinase [Spiroplasma litorale]